jgi:hypothetical protein
MISQALTIKEARGLLPGIAWHEWKQLRPTAVVCRAIELNENDYGVGWGVDWCLHIEGPTGGAISHTKDFDSHRELERAAEVASQRLGVPIVRIYGGFA